MNNVYLDNNATTRPADEVIAAMTHTLAELYANPSSMHRLGQEARRAVDEARASVASLINCSPSELLFTSGGTESINTAIRGLYRARRPRKRVLVSPVEHSATRGVWQLLAAEDAQIVELTVNEQGLLDLDELQSLLSDEVALVSLMWANNETGVLFDIPAIAALCRKAKVPLHCDATQAVGKIPVDVRAAEVDAMSFAAHKFHGPKGIGGLYVRRGTRMASLVVGGPQELGRRGGTENVPGAVGMGVAASLAKEHLPEMARVAQLRDRLEAGILASVPDAFVNGSRERRLPNTTNIGFSRLESEAILMLLSEKGVCASAGAACSSGSLEASPVLQAMHIDPKVAHGSIRFSLSRYTTEAEIGRALDVIPEAITRLRKVLPVG
jgi:cysteine desulfurase